MREESASHITPETIERIKRGEKVDEKKITIGGITYNSVGDIPPKYQEVVKKGLENESTGVSFPVQDIDMVNLNTPFSKFVRYFFILVSSVMGLIESNYIHTTLDYLQSAADFPLSTYAISITGIISGIVGYKIVEVNFEKWFKQKSELFGGLKFLKSYIKSLYMVVPSAMLSGALTTIVFLLITFFYSIFV